MHLDQGRGAPRGRPPARPEPRSSPARDEDLGGRKDGNLTRLRPDDPELAGRRGSRIDGPPPVTPPGKGRPAYRPAIRRLGSGHRARAGINSFHETMPARAADGGSRGAELEPARPGHARLKFTLRGGPASTTSSAGIHNSYDDDAKRARRNARWRRRTPAAKAKVRRRASSSAGISPSSRRTRPGPPIRIQADMAVPGPHRVHAHHGDPLPAGQFPPGIPATPMNSSVRRTRMGPGRRRRGRNRSPASRATTPRSWRRRRTWPGPPAGPTCSRRRPPPGHPRFLPPPRLAGVKEPHPRAEQDILDSPFHRVRLEAPISARPPGRRLNPGRKSGAVFVKPPARTNTGAGLTLRIPGTCGIRPPPPGIPPGGLERQRRPANEPPPRPARPDPAPEWAGRAG